MAAAIRKPSRRFEPERPSRQVEPSGKVIGVDMTADMVSKARANAAKLEPGAKP